MEEIARGLWHWTARHPHIGSQVSSYYLVSERVLLDPMLPPGGPEWFSAQGAEPEHILLTCRHHDRDSWRLQQEFGCEVHCVQSGCHELDARGRVTPFSFGDELPGGVVAHEVAAISPDETALHVPRHGALAVADGAVRWDGAQELSFVPDNLMDDPETTKQGLRRSYRGLLELDFDRLLLAHGDPVTADGKEALRHFAGQD
jgi:hypothetical protein